MSNKTKYLSLKQLAAHAWVGTRLDSFTFSDSVLELVVLEPDGGAQKLAVEDCCAVSAVGILTGNRIASFSYSQNSSLFNLACETHVKTLMSELLSDSDARELIQAFIKLNTAVKIAIEGGSQLEVVAPNSAFSLTRFWVSFEDAIVQLNEREIQTVIQKSGDNLALALLGCKSEVKQRIQNNMSKRAQKRLEGDLKLFAGVKQQRVSDARQQIVMLLNQFAT